MSTERTNTLMRGGSRFYVSPLTHEKLPGVTSVLGMLPKPFLGPWQAKLTAEYAVEHAAELFPLMMRDPKAATELIKGAPRRYTKERADIGTNAHALFETLAAGKTPRFVPAELQMYRKAFGEFLDAAQPVFVEQEGTVWDTEYGYAGSFDAVMTVEGETIAVDYKTSKDIHAETSLQLSAYRNAAHIMDSDGTLRPNHPTTGGAILHVAHDGQWQLVPAACGDTQFEVFKHLLAIFEWDTVGKRAVLGKAVYSG